jgi:hypothetical protein
VLLQQVSNANNQVADSVSRSQEGVRTYGQTIREANTALQEMINLQLAAVSAEFAVTNAHNNFLTAVQASTTAVDDSTTAVNEQKVAMDAATQAAIAEAVAAAELDRKQQELAGGTQSAKEQQDVLIGTLMTLATQSSPAVAAAIGEVITKLQTFGQQKPKPPLDVDPSSANKKTDDSQRKINVFGSLKPKPILDANPVPATIKTANVQRNVEVFGRTSVRATLDANNSSATTKTSAAKSAVDAFGRTRATATLDADTSRITAALLRVQERIRAVTGRPGLAEGIRNWRGGAAWVGERGPELVNLPRGSDVYSAAESKTIIKDTLRRVGLTGLALSGSNVPATASTMPGVGTSVTFGPGSVSVSFVGPTPSVSDGNAIGQAIGDGITQVLTRRRVATLGRLV